MSQEEESLLPALQASAASAALAVQEKPVNQTEKLSKEFHQKLARQLLDAAFASHSGWCTLPWPDEEYYLDDLTIAIMQELVSRMTETVTTPTGDLDAKPNPWLDYRGFWLTEAATPGKDSEGMFCLSLYL